MVLGGGPRVGAWRVKSRQIIRKSGPELATCVRRYETMCQTSAGTMVHVSHGLYVCRVTVARTILY